MADTWLVSACLLNQPCRYDGQPAKPEARARIDQLEGTLIPFCPEQAGGLPTPRPAADLRGGDGHRVLDGHARVLTHAGEDVTEAFVRGAELAAEAAERHSATAACLKARSPSCGAGRTHIDGSLQAGDGVTAAALKRRGLRVLTDEAI